MATKITAIILLAGLLTMFWGLAYAAEREPFKAALVVTRPGQAPEVRHLYASKGVCDSDITLEVKLVPSATRLECKSIERRK